MLPLWQERTVPESSSPEQTSRVDRIYSRSNICSLRLRPRVPYRWAIKSRRVNIVCVCVLDARVGFASCLCC